MSILYIIGIAAVGLVVWAVSNQRKMSAVGGEETRSFAAKWAEVESLLKTDSSAGWKLAVIEADKIMDSALKIKQMRGATMGERLRFASSQRRELRPVWEAHNLRNDLAHNSNFYLDKSAALRSIKLFKDGLKTLGVL
jgi:hypothetical protein